MQRTIFLLFFYPIKVDVTFKITITHYENMKENVLGWSYILVVFFQHLLDD
jgi:hypothetical protein